MNDSDFITGKYGDLTDIALEKRKQNHHLRERSINALVYKTKQNEKRVIREEIDFDKKDNMGKIAMDYALNSNIDTMRIFLEAFNEKREKSEEKYRAFKTKYQVRIKHFVRATGILAPFTSIVITTCILANVLDPVEIGSSLAYIKIGFSLISISCAIVAICLAAFTIYVGWRKGQLKNDQKHYENNIKVIEGKLGIRGKRETSYSLEKHDILQRQVRENTKLTSINKELARKNNEVIEKNTELIEENKELIEKNTELIEQNKGKISALEDQISTLVEMFQAVRTCHL